MKRLLLLLLLGLVTIPGVTGNKAGSLNILLIHSYHQEYPWTVSQHKAFVETLQASLPEYNIVFSTEYLDTFFKFGDARPLDFVPTGQERVVVE